MQVALNLVQNIEIGRQWPVAFRGLLGLDFGKSHQVPLPEGLLASAYSFRFFIPSGHIGHHLSCANWIAFEELQRLVNNPENADELR
jgi:hypothetical protein